jgi:hypothetical protein
MNASDLQFEATIVGRHDTPRAGGGVLRKLASPTSGSEGGLRCTAVHQN